MEFRVSYRKPTFVWQALLIVLPVALLAAVGFLSLRQDKLLAEVEATQRAQAVADELLPKIQAELFPSLESRLAGACFQVDQNGELLFPPPLLASPVPQPFDLRELSTQQAQLWVALQQANELRDTNALRSAIQAARNFLDSNPPTNFAAAAWYSVGLWETALYESKNAAFGFREVLSRYPDAVGETGLPLSPLAEFKLLLLLDSSDASLKQSQGSLSLPPAGLSLSWDSFCRSLVEKPTPLSDYLLQTARAAAQTAEAQQACDKWGQALRDLELLRRLYAVTRPHFQTNAIVAGVADEVSTLTSNRLLSSPAIKMPRVCWATLPQPWPTFVTNIMSADTNGMPIRSGVEVDEPNWLVTRIEGPALGLARFVDAGPSQTPGPIQNLRPTGRWDRVTSAFKPDPAGLERAAGSFLCRPEYEVGSNITAVVNEARSMPDYFGIGVEIAGRRLTRSAPDLHTWARVPYAGKGGGIRKVGSSELATQILASSTGPGESGGLKVNVYLTSASTLFERQATRTFWFGSLIAVAGLAALAGLASAWRAFHRQQALSQMKSNFVSSVSHELRAPIASVRLLAESLDLGKIQEPARQREYFRFIVQECRRLSGLIENVLDFSRIEQGRKQYEFEPTDVLELARQTAAVIEPYAADHGVRIDLRFPEAGAPSPDSQPVMDGKAIQQALINLADNAIKHSPKGETVTIGVEFIAASTAGTAGRPAEERAIPSANGEGGSLQLWVEDHGEGIPAAEHEKIFERFYRCGSELRRETPGVGIGLSIVKHIVEAHRGKIMVRSAPGEGSRFTIELPADPGADEPGKNRRRAARSVNSTNAAP